VNPGSTALREALRTCISKGLTFAAFREPGRPVRLMAQRSPAMAHLDAAALEAMEAVFVAAPFVSESGAMGILRPDAVLEFGRSHPDPGILEGFEGASPREARISEHMPRTVYTTVVEAAKAAINGGGLRKVVLSRTMSVPLDPALLPDLFLRMVEDQPGAFVCMHRGPEQGLWLGASPERLLRVEGESVLVDAIAGTLPVYQAPSEAAAWGEKERDEQRMVTEGILATFERLGMREVRTQGPEVLVAGRVAHLRTLVSAPREGIRMAGLARELHPSPAVCGTPTDAARAFILAHEPHDRGLYAGFWGPWRMDGRTELFVNIRSLRVVGKDAVLYVGGGITAASDAAREWEETEQKALTLRSPIEALRSPVS